MKNKSTDFPTHDSANIRVNGRRESYRLLVWGVLFTLFFLILFVLQPTLPASLDNLNYDFLLRHLPDNHASGKLVIVDVDEKSLKRYGQWPWPRYRVAELFEKIAAMKPSAIGLDMVFAEPDRTSAGRLLKDLGDTYKLKLAVDWLPRELSDNDKMLAEVLAGGPFVLGNKFQFNAHETSPGQCVLHPVKMSSLQKADDPKDHLQLFKSTGVLCNLKTLARQSSSSGFINFSPDPDGMLRRLPMLIRFNDETYASLGLACFLKFNQTDNLLLQKNGRSGPSLKFKGVSVPLDPRGQMLIKFRGPGKSYDYISAADIMEDRVPSDRLMGRIALIGTSAAGLNDLLTTPFDPIMPGVEVHATVVDNLMTGDFIALPDWSHGLILSLVLCLGGLLSFFIAFRRAYSGFIFMLLSIAGLWLTTQQLFFRTGLFVGTAFPITAMVCNYIFLTVLKYRLEEKKIIASMKELILTQDITIESMANLAESRDKETGGHIKRTRMYVKVLAEEIKKNPKYKKYLNDEIIDMLYKSAPLHDIGKVGIPDKILLKPGALTEEEFKLMKTHTTSGRDVIEASVRRLGKKSFLSIAEEMAYSHQEKWDGSGYPQGLKGEAIPVSGRLMALADVYDALISRRPYKPGITHEQAIEIIRKGRGTHFDPDIVDAFLEIHEQFRIIARDFNDSEEISEITVERPAS